MYNVIVDWQIAKHSISSLSYKYNTYAEALDVYLAQIAHTSAHIALLSGANRCEIQLRTMENEEIFVRRKFIAESEA